MQRHNAVGKIMLKYVESRASQLCVKRCIWLNLQVKVAQFFFSSAYVTLLSTTGYKVLKYSSRIHMVYLAGQQQNKLLQFPVCANVGQPVNRPLVERGTREREKALFFPQRESLFTGQCWRTWCAFYLRHSVTGLREAHPNSIFSLEISVLEYSTANNVMSCFSAQRCFLPKTQSQGSDISSLL